VRSLREFIDFAKASQSPLTFASAGIGTSTHLTGELFKRAAGIEMTHVPYRGITPAINDLIPGRVDFLMTPPIDQIKTGLVRGLAVTSSKRFPMLPDLPTVAEAGVPGFEVSSWLALFAPAKTSPEIVMKMNADATVALADPEVQRRLAQLYLLAANSTPNELAAFLASEIEKWGTVIKDAGIKIDG
jgi:tripartite-type tricarboxylate transporter receptor subunit TctC